MVARAEQTLGVITIHPLSHSHVSDQINTCVLVPECNVTLFYRGVCILLAMRKHLAKVQRQLQPITGLQSACNLEVHKSTISY